MGEGVRCRTSRQLCFASRQPQNATNVAQVPNGRGAGDGILVEQSIAGSNDKRSYGR